MSKTDYLEVGEVSLNDRNFSLGLNKEGNTSADFPQLIIFDPTKRQRVLDPALAHLEVRPAEAFVWKNGLKEPVYETAYPERWLREKVYCLLIKYGFVPEEVFATRTYLNHDKKLSTNKQLGWVLWTNNSLSDCDLVCLGIERKHLYEGRAKERRKQRAGAKEFVNKAKIPPEAERAFGKALLLNRYWHDDPEEVVKLIIQTGYRRALGDIAVGTVKIDNYSPFLEKIKLLKGNGKMKAKG